MAIFADMAIHLISVCLVAVSGLLVGNPVEQEAFVPHSAVDSAYVFSYSTLQNGGRNGLHFAWSGDGTRWQEIGPEYSFVKSDYGDWGSQKRMLEPHLVRMADGVWTAWWRVNEQEDVLALTTSRDLVHWKPQGYYPSSEVLSLFPASEQVRIELPFSGKVTGDVHKVSWDVVQLMLDAVRLAAAEDAASSIRLRDDVLRFPGLEPQRLSVSIPGDVTIPISDKLVGIFFEDINYAADGGLYAELVQNRDFEYSKKDVGGRGKDYWNASWPWYVSGSGMEWRIETSGPIHTNNPHYAHLSVHSPGAALCNPGYDGIHLKAGDKYDLSFFARRSGGNAGKFEARLVTPDGTVLACKSFRVGSSHWKKSSLVLEPVADCDSAALEIAPLSVGDFDLDMISLFPQKTFKGRKNGLRADLAQALYDMHPKFVRFPGGCVAHGNGIDNIYRWKNTIGPLEARVPDRNLWGYHQTMGLGYFEYFQMCEDLGAEPLPVIAAGVPCQNSSDGGYGQQGGIPIGEMDTFIQDIVDLVEWANGDPKTSEWARMRAEAGHREPFGLKYIGIGNEDLISEVFEERFRMIFEALRQRCPEITVVGTVGPFWQGSDYEEGWKFASELGVPVVDEHYYTAPGWYLNHQDYYDTYRRNGTRVYLGEYAAHNPERANCLETALCEAVHLCNVERNGDVVEMTSYAPLFGREGHTQWNPDLIYFNGSEVRPTTGYQVQKLFGRNSGDLYLPFVTSLESHRSDVYRRLAVSAVKDSVSGDIIVKAVNVLPVECRVTVDLPDAVAGKGYEVEQSVLTGDLEDCNLVPQTSSFVLTGSSFDVSMPAYSFMVWRVVVK